MKTFCYFDYPIGRVGIASDGDAICGVYFDGDKDLEKLLKEDSSNSDATKEQDATKEKVAPIILKADKQLKEYFAGKRKDFDLTLKMNGTEFQKSVWNALLTIPYGETKSYKDIAVQIGNEKACRAVGMANNRNPIAIIVPCHRVIGHNGTLVGYGGGLDIKQTLLDLEER